ncbi:MAG TPA: replication-associated recombination protein A [Candidatus Cloacimonetes bacterium]|nr:replication-associated recombination protein A [Candidatus Cloacimonadota bacterium]HEX37306.1 replication-associated recombination protein A [Candidatus Cloacimonadota bacterium]
MDEELFTKDTTIDFRDMPLAERVRPQTLDEFVGQQRILEKDTILRNIIENNELTSLIFWGPPGTGKTTLARIIANRTNAHFIFFSAVLSKITEVREAMKEAEFNLRNFHKKTILFVDEIHRFNKAQQDAFLPFVEKGVIILIGATTENPSFEVIAPLLSRCKVIVLEALDEEDIYTIITKSFENPRSDIQDYRKMFDKKILHFISDYACGDARVALNSIELIIKAYGEQKEKLTVERIKKLLEKNNLFYDKDREEHYNIISALHKSLRGSDPQAGLYWLARMLEAGEDPKYIVRRLIRFASEDVGLADPQALVQAVTVKDSIHFLGMPEANTALAQLVIYLATAPKSNKLYTAYKAAAEDAKNTSHLGVPYHIRNAPTELMKDLGYGKDYKYSHEFEQAYSYQNYFPEKMKERTYYIPTQFGFEKEIKKRLEWWKKLREKEQKK